MKSTLLILLGPSGVGKTTLAKEAVKLGIATYMVRSITDRVQGPNEDNSEYKFISKGSFDASACVEHANYAGNNYGILKSEIEAALETPRPIAVTEIEGAKQLREYCKGRCRVAFAYVSVSDAVIRGRLERRGRGDVEKRMAKVLEDRKMMTHCDYSLQNPEGMIGIALDTITEIYEMEEQFDG